MIEDSQLFLETNL